MKAIFWHIKCNSLKCIRFIDWFDRLIKACARNQQTTASGSKFDGMMYAFLFSFKRNNI